MNTPLPPPSPPPETTHPDAATRALAGRLGHTFRNPTLFEAALTHRSFSHEQPVPVIDNQRLEFLGDAVLGFLLADRVFQDQHDHPEGMLTILRSALASGVALAEKARQFELGAALRLGLGERRTGGQDRDSNLADALEAVIGAVYLDGGIEAVSAVFDRLFREDMAALRADPWRDNPKGRLQNLAHHTYHVEPVYELVSETGPRHDARFQIRVRVGGTPAADGWGTTKRAAQAAAAAAWLKQTEPPPSSGAGSSTENAPA